MLVSPVITLAYSPVSCRGSEGVIRFSTEPDYYVRQSWTSFGEVVVVDHNGNHICALEVSA